MIKRVKIEDAVGMELAHSVTRILPGQFKGEAFSRGHIIKEEDIPAFRAIGKEHIYIMKLGPDEVHEEDAAVRIAQAVAGPGLRHSKPSEARVNLVANHTGVVKINVAAINAINSLGDFVLTTIHNNSVCQEGKTIAAMRITPIAIASKKLDEMDAIARRYAPVISVLPLKHKKIGMVITGNEVFNGTIKDGFTPVLHKKLELYGCTVNNRAFVPDNAGEIAQTILKFRDSGSEIILCCSGMSVDPDDVTPVGIRKSGATIAFYGLPVMPCAMFMYGKLNETHILGVPACVLHAPTTAFDLLFPRVLAGEELTFAETRLLGHGGLCLGCKTCAFPVCPLGK